MGILERERGMLPPSVLSSKLEGASISRIRVLDVTGHEFLSPSESEIFLTSFLSFSSKKELLNAFRAPRYNRK